MGSFSYFCAKPINMKNIVAANQGLEVIWYLRLTNALIDFVVIMAILFIIIIFCSLLTYAGIYGPSEWFQTMSEGGYRLLGIASLYLYYSIMEITTQRTVAKFITGTMVIAEDGSKPEPRSILGRSLCRIFWIEAFSFIRAFPRGWHDSASGTYVVHTKKYKEIIELKDALDEIGVAAL